jgi:protein involved in polysaccharide export with SLBB domain
MRNLVNRFMSLFLGKRRPIGWTGCLGVLLMGWLGSGCETLPTEVDPSGFPAGEASATGMELSVGEKVTIIFAGIPSPPPIHEERVREDGTLHPPYLSQPIQASGLTPPQLQSRLHEAYVPKIFTTISITVGTEDRLFTLNGEVIQPGRYPYVGETTAVEAISQAGGLTDFAKKRKIGITRANGTKFYFDYEKARRDSRFDPQVYPRDIIDVPRRLY